MKKNNSQKNKLIKLPSFAIAGAAKSGTTSLSRYLDGHPEVYLPAQEMNYFAFARHAPDYTVVHSKLMNTFDRYQSFYRFTYEKAPHITGEKSVSYLYAPWVNHVIKNIKAIHPLGESLKIIIILRHPVDRMYSQYLFNTRNNERLPFNQAINAWPQRKTQGWVPAYDYIGASYYAEAVNAYLESFSYVKVVLFDDLKTNPQEMLKELYQFLEVGSDFIPQKLGESFNFSGLPNKSMLGKIYRLNWIRRIVSSLKKTLPDDITERIALSVKSKAMYKPELDNETRSELTELFREDIRKLEKTINRDLSHWLT